jgi:hypothetical protein
MTSVNIRSKFRLTPPGVFLFELTVLLFHCYYCTQPLLYNGFTLGLDIESLLPDPYRIPGPTS